MNLDQVAELVINLTNQYFLFQNQIQSLMSTQHDVAQQLSAFSAQLGKVNDEINGKVADLQAQLQQALSQGGDGITPELQAAVDAVAAAVQKLDDIVPDAPVITPEPTPAPVDQPIPVDQPAPADTTVDTTAGGDVTPPADTTVAAG